MSTICFDIKRCDENNVCIQHADLNFFEYEKHLPFSFKSYDDSRNDYVQDENVVCIYVLVGEDKDYEGIETLLFSSNSLSNCILCKKRYQHERYKNLKILELPLWKKEGLRYIQNDMKDQIKIYCPEKLNEKYHVYASEYKKIEETEGDFPKYQWVPPLPLER